MRVCDQGGRCCAVLFGRARWVVPVEDAEARAVDDAGVEVQELDGGVSVAA